MVNRSDLENLRCGVRSLALCCWDFKTAGTRYGVKWIGGREDEGQEASLSGSYAKA